MQQRTSRGALALLTLCVAGGCGDREIALDKPVEWLAPARAVDNALIMIDKGSDRALVLPLDPLSNDAKVVPLPTEPQLTVARNGVSEVLVLSRGRRMTAAADADPSELSAIDADGHLRRYPLGNPFDEIAQSDDGRYAIMFRTGEADR